MLSIGILLTSVVTCLMVGSLVVSRGFRDPKVIIYGLLTLSLLLMSVSNHLTLTITNDQLFFVRGVMVSSTIVAYLIYLLIYSLKKRHRDKPFYKKAILYLTIIVAIIDCTGFLFPAVKAQVPPLPILGPGIVLYFAHFITVITLAIRRLVLDMMGTKNKREKSQYTFLIFGLLPAIFLAPLTSFVLPRVGIPQTVIVTPIYAVIFVLFVGYAIVRHGLFDIRQAVVRTVTYALSLGTLSIIYYYLGYVASTVFFSGQSDSAISVGPVNVVLALGLAFIFQPVKKFFDRITNRIFYKDNYNTDDFFARVNSILSYTTDLRNLLERTAYEIGTTLKAEQAFLFIFTTAEGNYVMAGTEKHRHLPKHDAILLEQKCGGKDDIIEASLLADDDLIKRMMISHGIELILPLIQDGDVIGYLCLGDHKTSDFTRRDIKALYTLSDALIVAIQNALAVHEIREINASLQQRINNATRELRSKNATLRQLDKIKDEFLSIASHQLRTPLTSVKGYLSMVLEGDAGKITKAQHQLLNEAFQSSENMVRLISDFLNVSRIQTGKFVLDRAPVDLSVLVEQEMETLKPNAAQRNMKLIYKKPKEFPILNIDEGKFRQVVMNFADNAIYYSHDGSKIDVKLSVEGKDVVFTVKDTGIGVPKSERDNLFSKFFRATNAKKQRPDGTGVGIYLAKKIVDTHGGQIIFESTEGKGSMFGFRLPIAFN